jgi:hypothetical protein
VNNSGKPIVDSVMPSRANRVMYGPNGGLPVAGQNGGIPVAGQNGALPSMGPSGGMQSAVPSNPRAVGGGMYNGVPSMPANKVPSMTNGSVPDIAMEGPQIQIDAMLPRMVEINAPDFIGQVPIDLSDLPEMPQTGGGLYSKNGRVPPIIDTNMDYEDLLIIDIDTNSTQYQNGRKYNQQGNMDATGTYGPGKGSPRSPKSPNSPRSTGSKIWWSGPNSEYNPAMGSGMSKNSGNGNGVHTGMGNGIDNGNGVGKRQGNGVGVAKVAGRGVTDYTWSASGNGAVSGKSAAHASGSASGVTGGNAMKSGNVASLNGSKATYGGNNTFKTNTTGNAHGNSVGRVVAPALSAVAAIALAVFFL